MRPKSSAFLPGILALALAFWLGSVPGVSGQSLCARVKIEIDQELTIERQAFEARLRIGNGSDSALEQVSVTMKFQDAAGQPVVATSDPNNTAAKFFFRPVANINNITGVAAGATATLTWLIIPARGAAGPSPQGTLYYVGATLIYRVAGNLQTVEVSPDHIFVKPMPALQLDYFLPRDVQGDEPFTPQIESPIPFTLGVRVKNVGGGTAKSLAIESSQPKIVENEHGLIINFQILGSEVNGQPASPSLLVNFGDIAPDRCGMGRWQMITTLSGKFVDFTASYTHADALGGEVTSLLERTTKHTLIHDVLVDLPGRDAVRDFLALDGDTLRVYESEGLDAVATDRTGAATLTGNGAAAVTVNMPATPGFLYARFADPFVGSKVLAGAVRSDGKRLKADNVWLTKVWNNAAHGFDYALHLFDANLTGAAYTYALSFTGVSLQNLPPVLAYMPDRTVQVGRPFILFAQATDPNGTVPALSAGAMPPGATFQDLHNGTGEMDWTPAADQANKVFAVQVTASDGVLSTSQTVRLSTTAGRLLKSWKDRYFPGITDPAIVGDGADPDGDGLANLLEYALDLDPTQAADSGMEIGVDRVGADSFVTLTYARRTDDPDLAFEVQGAGTVNDQAAWTAQTQEVAVSQDGLRPGLRRVKVRDTVSLAASPRRFLRLQVTIPPSADP